MFLNSEKVLQLTFPNLPDSFDMKYFLFLFFIFLLGSCTKTINVNIPPGDEKPILNGLISPKRTLIHCSKSTSIFDSNTMPLSDAIINVVSSDGMQWALDYIGNGFYSNDLLSIQAGKSYTINAQTSIGDFVAVDTIPTLITPLVVSYSTSRSVDENGDELLDLDLKLIDPPGNNYYEFLLMEVYYNEEVDSSRITYWPDIIKGGFVLSSEGDLDFNPATVLFSDQLLAVADTNAISIQYKPNSIPLKQIKGKIPHFSESGFYIRFRSCSYNYYKFQKSWIRSRYYLSVTDKLSGVFNAAVSSEPLPAFSNLKGDALGFWVGYTEGYMEVKYIP